MKGGFTMINILKLKARLKEKDLTQVELAKKMGIDPATLNKKLNNEFGETLKVAEAQMMKEILEIPNSEVIEYFFK